MKSVQFLKNICDKKQTFIVSHFFFFFSYKRVNLSKTGETLFDALFFSKANSILLLHKK